MRAYRLKDDNQSAECERICLQKALLTGDPGSNLRPNKYVGHLESKERLRIQPAQLFNFS